MLWREWITRFSKPITAQVLGSLEKIQWPTQKKAQTKSDFARWLENLPYANLDDTTDRFIQLLQTMSESTLNISEKIRRLSLMHPVTIKLGGFLCHSYAADFVAKQPKKDIWLEKAIVMHRLMAESFYSIAVQAGDEITAPELANCIFRALAQYAQMNERNYQIYRVIKPEIWQAVYKLYEIAEQHDLLSMPIAQEGGTTLRKDTITHQIAGISLLALANPYKLSPPDIERVLKHLSVWANNATLERENFNECQFVFSFKHDCPPTYRELVKPEQMDGTFRGLTVTPLLNSLETLLQHRERSGNQSAQDEDYPEALIRHLLTTWKSVVARSEPRQPAEGKIRVLVGLAASSAFLRDQFGFKQEQAKLAAEAKKEQELDFSNLSLADVSHGEPGAKLTPKKAAPPPAPKVSMPISPLSMRHDTKEWDMVDVSPRGLCICAPKEFASEIVTGQILATQRVENATEPNWQVGIVRWAKIDDEKITIGIQIISRDGFPVLIQNAHQKDSGHRLAGILSSAPEEPWESAILIAPHLPYRIDEIVTLNGQHYDMQVRLISCVESSRQCKIFHYEVIEHIYQ